MSRGLSANPNDRMGVFKSLSEVPQRYRLEQSATAFDGRDAWQEYLDASLYERYPDASQQFYDGVDRAGRRWKEHMESRGRHHALATPADVERWCGDLHENASLHTVCHEYWVRIEGFYTWMQGHTDYPHVYHPFWMAVTEYPLSREVWNLKLSGGNRKGGTWDE